MKKKRDKVITCRVTNSLLVKMEAEAERQHRSVAGLVYSLLLTTFGQEIHGKEA